MEFPKEIRDYIQNRSYKVDQVGMTSSEVYLFDDCVLKVEKCNIESNNEFEVLTFLNGKVPVPKILKYVKKDGYNYLLMEKLDGYMAFDSEIIKHPENMIRLLASAITKLWAVDIEDYHPEYNLDQKLGYVEQLINENKIDASLFDKDIVGEHDTPKKLLKYLKENKPVEDNVFTHGDYCLPNVLFKENNLVGFIDLGRACISDRYQDIALCLRSMKYNLGKNYKEEYFNLFLQEVGVTFDSFKYNYYLLLDELL